MQQSNYMLNCSNGNAPTKMLISVVIPTYNYGHFVCEAVESVLAQTHCDIEVIVVDDGSTDDTRCRLSCFGNRIRYIYQENRGLSAARNTGIRETCGEWVALLDADDLWHPQKIERELAAALSVPGCRLVGTRPANVLPDVLPSAPRVRVLGVRDFLLSAPIGPSSALIRKDAFETVGLFDEDLKSVEDRDMWLRIAVHFPCVQIDSPCWWYRPHPNQMNRNAQRMFENYDRVLKRFFAAHPKYEPLAALAYSYLYFDAAWSYFAQGNRWTAVAYLGKSLCVHPQSLGGQVRNLRWARAKLLLRYTFGKGPHHFSSAGKP